MKFWKSCWYWKLIGILPLLIVTAYSTASQGQNFGSVHLLMGNPSNATTDTTNSDNFLMIKPQYALSYNNGKGTPNWVSWQLNESWLGPVDRCRNFSPDPTLPPNFLRIVTKNYTGSGFTRGHMTRSGDRTATSVDNCATFVMTNIVPQTEDLNAGPWLELENLSTNLVRQGKELYIIAGPSGRGGTGKNGFKTTIGGNKITVPTSTWKVVVVLDQPDLGLKGITKDTRVIAVNMPNRQGISNISWKSFAFTVDEIENLTGYDFLSNVPETIQDVIEARKDNQ
jgi:endonuclease G